MINVSITRNFDFFIQWHLTERCNLACRHCYQAGGRRREPTLPEIGMVVSEVAATLREWSETYAMDFTPSFNLTGGEPLLRDDLFEIVEIIATAEAEVYLLTNGTLIDRARAEKLSALGVKGVQVSLEGPPEIHDAIRGRGSFGAARAGVEKLLDAGLQVTLNLTLSRLNAGAMPEVISLAEALGVQRLGFSRLVPAGRGREMAGEMLKAEEVRKLYEILLAVSVPGLEIVTGDPVAAQLHPPAGGIGGCTPIGGCAAGVSGVTLLSDGTILPCRRLEVPIGNIFTDSLREVWATSDVLAALRDKSRYRGKCGSCRRWADCRGCRAIAHACGRADGAENYLAEDPQCFIDPSS
jgi:MoaA/NifB/PqqE/SkfB family radical SAM enzyme